ncbi:MAG: inorganic phosphate transporter [Parachlamydiaceae bacterium]|nr:inorganic phosphate transporter [Parachlamydiaceae bacterium]
MPVDTILLVLVLLAGLYMAWNIGANDVANAMGTSVGSGALTLRRAVVVAAFLEFGGAFLFGSHVSETVQTGILDISTFASEPRVLVYGMLASLISAGVWLQIASYYGWPVSTTHTIVGAIVGFGVVSGGMDAIQWENVFLIVSSWLISPLSGAIMSFLIFTFLRKSIFYAPDPLAAAKRMTPIIVFGVVLVLMQVVIFSGLNNLNLDLSSLEIILWSVSIAALCSLTSWFLVKRVTGKVRSEKTGTVTDVKVLADIEKAKRNLIVANRSMDGEAQYRMSMILDEIDSLKRSLNKVKVEGLELSSSEYAPVEKVFGYLQIISACLMAFAHGANDVANAIGPLAAALAVLKTGVITPYATIPTWVLALGGFGIVVGLATWGWRVIETIGKKITELTPTRGFAAEFGAATTIVIASRLGMPVSTTHTLVGSVLGVGMARGIEALNLAMTRDIFISWLITVPAGAIVSILFFNLFLLIF